MTQITNRHAAVAMLLLSVAIGVYVVTASWTFVEMRDGTMIGSFPLAYVALCMIFAVLMGVGKTSNEPLEDVGLLTWAGVFRLSVFTLGGLLIAFFHEKLGFATLCILFLAVIAYFMGQRRPMALAVYCILVTAGLFTLFTLLGFDLTILPSPDSFGS